MRTLPVWVRYALTTLIVLVCFGVRYVLDVPEVGYPYPFLLFLPGIAFSALVFDRGTSFYATILSALLAVYFFVEPRHSFAFQHIGQVVALAVFVVIGFMISGLIEALRNAVDELAEAQTRLGSTVRELGASAESLKESESLKAAMLEAALDCIIAIDGKSRVLEWNSIAEKTFGYSRTVALGRDLAELIIPPEARERHYRGMRHFLATGEGPLLGSRTEVEGLRSDGSRVPVELAINATQVGGTVQFTAYLRDISKRKEAEAALRDSEQRLRATYEHAFVGIAEVDPAGHFMRVNEQFCSITGYTREELVKRTFAEITHPEDRTFDLEQFHRQMAGDLEVYRIEKRYIHKDGHEVWVGLSASAVADEAGRCLYGVRVARDISQRKRSEQHRELLVNELNHRVKNTLAVVQAIAMQTFRNVESSSAAQNALAARLASLAKAHDVLTRESWVGADLIKLVESATMMYQGENGTRIRHDGPPVRLPPHVALSLSMALHELGTNAAKHGALSTDEGRVDISWRIEPGGAGRLRFRWVESGGPAVAPPLRRGFGSRLIERMLTAELGGNAQMKFEPNGLVCVLEVQLQQGSDRAA